MRPASHCGIGRVRLAAGIFLVCWLVVSEILVPRLPVPAYQAVGPGRSQLVGPLASRETFLEYWRSYSRTVTGLLIVAGAVAMLASSGGFQEYVRRRQGLEPEPEVRLARPRRVLAHGLITFILTGSAFATLTGLELWPFSPYKMYSQLQSGSASRWRLFGSWSGGEIDLSLVPGLTPFDPNRFHWAMQGMRGHGASLDDVGRYIWQRYEGARADGSVNGPTLRAIRLYRLAWAADTPTLREQPDTAQLVYEWSVPR
jgi:hypothetical protein